MSAYKNCRQFKVLDKFGVNMTSEEMKWGGRVVVVCVCVVTLSWLINKNVSR